MNRERRRPRVEEVAPFLGGVIVVRYVATGNITQTARDVMMHRATVRSIIVRHFGTMLEARKASAIYRLSQFQDSHQCPVESTVSDHPKQI
jgi:hypothetical protein